MENYSTQPTKSNNVIRRLTSKTGLLVIGVVVVLLVIGGFYYTRQRNNNNKAATVATGSKVIYPDAWKESKLSNAEVKNARILLKLTRNDPSAEIIISDLSDNSELSSNFDIQKLPDQLAKELQSKKAEVINKSVTKLGGLDTVQIRYNRQDPKKKTNYEYLQIVIPTKKQTFYFTARAKSGDFTKAEGDITNIANSFAEYVNAHQ